MTLADRIRDGVAKHKQNNVQLTGVQKLTNHVYNLDINFQSRADIFDNIIENIYENIISTANTAKNYYIVANVAIINHLFSQWEENHVEMGERITTFRFTAGSNSNNEYSSTEMKLSFENAIKNQLNNQFKNIQSLLSDEGIESIINEVAYVKNEKNDSFNIHMVIPIKQFDISNSLLKYETQGTSASLLRNRLRDYFKTKDGDTIKRYEKMASQLSKKIGSSNQAYSLFIEHLEKYLIQTGDTLSSHYINIDLRYNPVIISAYNNSYIDLQTERYNPANNSLHASFIINYDQEAIPLDSLELKQSLFKIGEETVNFYANDLIQKLQNDGIKIKNQGSKMAETENGITKAIIEIPLWQFDENS